MGWLRGEVGGDRGPDAAPRPGVSRRDLGDPSAARVRDADRGHPGLPLGVQALQPPDGTGRLLLSPPEPAGLSEAAYFRHAVEAVMVVEALLHGGAAGRRQPDDLQPAAGDRLWPLGQAEAADTILWPCSRLGWPPRLCPAVAGQRHAGAVTWGRSSRRVARSWKRSIAGFWRRWGRATRRGSCRSSRCFCDKQGGSRCRPTPSVARH